MNIENYVCTLEQAKKLDKLLGKRESIFYWYKESIPDSRKIPSEYTYQLGSKNVVMRRFNHGQLKPEITFNLNSHSAYTSQELGEMISEIELFFSQDAIRRLDAPLYYRFKDYEDILLRFNGFEAQARAEFLINLLESKNEDKTNI